MSVFTPVSDKDIQNWLTGYAIGTLQELKGILSGIENTNYFLTTTHGRYVLTLFEKLQAAELPFYLNLMAHLAKFGIPCPIPIENLAHRLLGELNGKPACIVTRLSGASITLPTQQHCAKVGKMLAEMHLAGRNYSGKISNPRGLGWCKEIADKIMDHLGTSEQRLLRDEIAFQSEFSRDSLPSGVVHADLFRDNILFENDEISGIIDFYYSCHDCWLYDIAVTVNDWCLDENEQLDTLKVKVLLSAYNQVRPLLAEEHNAWPIMLRAAALRFWLSRFFDLTFPRPGELTHVKDPMHFQKLLAWEVATHAQLMQAWL